MGPAAPSRQLRRVPRGRGILTSRPSLLQTPPRRGPGHIHLLREWLAAGRAWAELQRSAATTASTADQKWS